MGQRKFPRPVGGKERERKSGVVAQIVVGVAIALVAGGSAPWWWSKVFPERQRPSVAETGKAACPKGYFYLQSRATDLFLNLDQEGKLVQSKQNGGETQIWTAITATDQGYCYLTTKSSVDNSRDEYLEIKRGHPDDYPGIGRKRTLNADDQEWALEEVQPGYYVITSKRTGDAIDVPYGDPQKTLLGFFWPHKHNNQQWKLIPF
jgi:hypothetical protein